MAEFLAQNLGNIIVAAVLALGAALAIRSIVKSKKKGACAGCSGCQTKEETVSPCSGCAMREKCGK